jgi:hypothetical protein
MKKLFLIALMILGVELLSSRVQAVPVVSFPIAFANYYVWAYTEAYEDRSFVYADTTAGIDAMGWIILATTDQYSGLFLINMAAISKTVYPVVQLLGKPISAVKQRAWIDIATNLTTLLLLKWMGHPALQVESFLPEDRWVPGIQVAYSF